MKVDIACHDGLEAKLICTTSTKMGEKRTLVLVTAFVTFGLLNLNH